MAFEKFDLETLNAERRVAMAKSFRTITVPELKEIGTKLFPMADDAWRELFFQFLGDNQHATYHYAVTSDEVHIVYCKDRDRGLWFTAHGAKGPLGERGRTVMKEMVENHK
jgi:hypothetical protein